MDGQLASTYLFYISTSSPLYHNLSHLSFLIFLQCRKNKIKMLPEGVPGANHKDLTLFHISSNEISSLPSSICECPSLTTIYANSNKIYDLPSNFSQMKSLESCNLSNNSITKLSVEFLERFGKPGEKDGKCMKVREIFLLYLTFTPFFFGFQYIYFRVFLLSQFRLPLCVGNFGRMKAA